MTLRPFLTFGYAALYYRWGVLFGAREYINDLGLLIEFPIPLTKREELMPPPSEPAALGERQ